MQTNSKGRTAIKTQAKRKAGSLAKSNAETGFPEGDHEACKSGAPKRHAREDKAGRKNALRSGDGAESAAFHVDTGVWGVRHGQGERIRCTGVLSEDRVVVRGEFFK